MKSALVIVVVTLALTVLGGFAVVRRSNVGLQLVASAVPDRVRPGGTFEIHIPAQQWNDGYEWSKIRVTSADGQQMYVDSDDLVTRLGYKHSYSEEEVHADVTGKAKASSQIFSALATGSGFMSEDDYNYTRIFASELPGATLSKGQYAVLIKSLGCPGSDPGFPPPPTHPVSELVVMLHVLPATPSGTYTIDLPPNVFCWATGDVRLSVTVGDS